MSSKATTVVGKRQIDPPERQSQRLKTVKMRVEDPLVEGEIIELEEPGNDDDDDDDGNIAVQFGFHLRAGERGAAKL